MHQYLANATFQVIAGQSRGSGFSFMYDDLVITNFHVVSTCVDLEGKRQTIPVSLKTEANEHLDVKILNVDVENDFAVMQLQSPLPSGRTVLQPVEGYTPVRGVKLIFSGYPHGLPQLITSEAIISAPMINGRFSIDGMVNGGNSGGPIIDMETGKVLGIVTQRRYIMGDQADVFGKEIAELRHYLAEVSKHSRVELMGVNFGQMADMFGKSLQIVSDMMLQNANSGIGTGFSMQPIVDVIAKLKTQ